MVWCNHYGLVIINRNIIKCMNAKEEFIRHTSSFGMLIKCAQITKDEGRWLTEEDYYAENHINLKIGWLAEDFKEFIDKLDFNYNSSYGGQQLFGIIWYEDGTWSDRGEYDGSEWWKHNKCPVIPKDLM